MNPSQIRFSSSGLRPRNLIFFFLSSHMFLMPIYVQKPLLRKRSIPMVKKKKNYVRTSLAIQWLRLWVSNAGDTGSTSSQRTNIPYSPWCNQKVKSILKKKIKNHIKLCVFWDWTSEILFMKGQWIKKSDPPIEC